MFRPPIVSKSSVSNGVNKQSNSAENSPTTIKEIRSRNVGSALNNNAKNLLANRRQAMSTERLNGSPNVSSIHSDKERSPSLSGSSNSINGSPSRSGGLNRTASRVSRFRSAKAVFERLSSNSGSTSNIASRSDRPSIISEKSRGTVASRYAAAAAARATTHATTPSSLTTSPRTRSLTGLAARDGGKSDNNKSTTNSSKGDATQPKPQPRIISSRNVQISTLSQQMDKTRLPSNTMNQPKSNIQAKPPSKDLLDKIVLEIAGEAEKIPNPDCTIRDLSSCDISGIPDTLDFDRCFQDVEMMTEEEARKLLSRKSNSSSPSIQESSVVEMEVRKQVGSKEEAIESKDKSVFIEQRDTLPVSCSTTAEASSSGATTVSPSTKCKVRFSEEPVKIYDTHAVEDYDRRNDDIDPVAASAEYEIEKSQERENAQDSDDEDLNRQEAVKTPDHLIKRQDVQDSSNLDDSTDALLRNSHESPHSDLHGFSGLAGCGANEAIEQQSAKHAEELANQKEYIETLEREVHLKRILEQNLRDLQSQYYEAVKELDDYKSNTDTKLSNLEQDISDLNSKLETSQNELSDSRERSNQFEEQLNDIKESSQMLEKKYHRAKRIIKDMQNREQSFTRREQLYQQKLDEIEHELGVLIESIDKTIYEEGHKFYAILSEDINNCQRQHQAQLDVVGLIKQMLINFSENQSTQNPQIKQRVVSILEQQLANLLIMLDGTTMVSGKNIFLPTIKGTTIGDINSLHQQQLESNNSNSNRHSQNSSYQSASHRLSQPNLPHPIGVGGQPTKLFHGLNPIPPIPVPLNESSPPQSVNSYPSTNSLNSLNNNNNQNANNNNNSIIMPSKIREIQMTNESSSTTNIEEKFQPVPDIQVPYQTNEWHDKPVSEWTTTQVSTWLLALGLDQYISKFEDRNVNGQSLINLDSTVLKGLGVLNSNDRNLLKKKIRELRVEMEKEKKLIEKKMKENLKEKSKNKPIGAKSDTKADNLQNKSSWKRGLLS